MEAALCGAINRQPISHCIEGVAHTCGRPRYIPDPITVPLQLLALFKPRHTPRLIRGVQLKAV